LLQRFGATLAKVAKSVSLQTSTEQLGSSPLTNLEVKNALSSDCYYFSKSGCEVGEREAKAAGWKTSYRNATTPIIFLL